MFIKALFDLKVKQKVAFWVFCQHFKNVSTTTESTYCFTEDQKS